MEKVTTQRAITSPTLRLLQQQHSCDQSRKMLWQLIDGRTVESIYFSFREQVYLCLSSQVGCNVGCPFCATGQQRVLRNLTMHEIIAQVTETGDLVRASGERWPVDHLAFAGMGEPLRNLEAVRAAATHLRAAGLAQTVSVSTAGLPAPMRELAETAATAVNQLFLSLHATTDEQRSVLVPVNKKYRLAPVLEAARFFAERTATRVTATYLLFEGINDTDADLRRLQRLLDPMHFLLQLSEWNPIPARAFRVSPRLEEFEARLTEAGFEVFVQRSKGRDIEGGCGQLRSRALPLLAGDRKPERHPSGAPGPAKDEGL
jgi:23S rRNA (adenine2503-C2)-methyltransferase